MISSLTACFLLFTGKQILQIVLKVGRRSEIRGGCVAIHYSASLRACRQGGEQGNLETLVHYFAKLGRYKKMWIL